MTHLPQRCIALALLALSAAVPLRAAEEAPKPATPPAPEIKDEELQRAPRQACAVFPWVVKARANPAPPPAKPAAPTPGQGTTPPQPATASALPDMSSGDRIIQAFGDFAATPGATPDKSCLVLSKDIEINMIQPDSVSVLRAQKFKLTQDVKTGQTELLEANDQVEIILPERKGKGEVLVYETKYGPHDEIIKDLFTLEGNHAKNRKAVLWQGNDIIEAEKFIDDRRLETFRALGNPAAIITLPANPDAAQPPPGAPAAKTGTGTGTGTAASSSSSGMLPNFSLSAGGKVRLDCEGELFSEGPSGRVTLTRNAIIQQEGQTAPDGTQEGGVKLASDEAVLLLDVPPPGQPDANNSVFSGHLHKIECKGRVDIKTATHVILCDFCTIDMQQNTVLMEMKNPKDEVHVYIKDDPPGSGRTMLARKSLLYNMVTSDMQAPLGMKMEPLPDVIPSNRPGGVPIKSGVTPPKSSAAPKSGAATKK